MKRSLVEGRLRKLFESGISYNLLLGRLSNRTELDDFEIRLNEVDPTHRAYVASLINSAFFPEVDSFEVFAKLSSLADKGSKDIAPYLYCLTLNWPNLSWELLTSAKRSLLSPAAILQTYYDIRMKLDSNSLDSIEATMVSPTLIALDELEKKLTSQIVSIKDFLREDGSSHCRLFSHRRFKESHDGVHRHLLEIAHEISMGRDPLDKVQFPLLDNKNFSQWGKVLNALLCYLEDMSPQDFVKASPKYVPRGYLETTREAKNIEPYIVLLLKRQRALLRFCRPNDDDYSQGKIQSLEEQLEPLLASKMILCHHIMLYLSLLKHDEWTINLKKTLDNLKVNSHPNKLQKNSEKYNDLISRSIEGLGKEYLVEENPVGLPLIYYTTANSTLDPMSLLEEFYSVKTNTNADLINEFVKKHGTFSLIIPQTMRFDTSTWLKPPVMLRLGEPLIIECNHRLELPKRLHLAGLVKSNEYVYETLIDNLESIEINDLEGLLQGVCCLWYLKLNEVKSLPKFHTLLSKCLPIEIDVRTLRKRKNIAQEWLNQWPNVNLFKEKL